LAQFPLTDDSYTTSPTANNAALGTTNYGGGPYLLVAAPTNNNSSTADTYLRTDLSVLPAAVTASNIQKANLRLYIDAITQAGSIDVHQVSATWSESLITYNNFPSSKWGTLVASAVAIRPKKQFIDVDVTSAVTAWLTNPQSNFGLVLSPTAGSGVSVSFDSKENTNTSHNAELQLVLVSAGPQGPQGPQGIPGVSIAGPPGAAATVAVGTTTTLAAGSQATVTNTGTTSAAVLNFGIPQGTAGSGGSGGGNVMVASAFLPGSLTGSAYTAADIKPNQGITVTRVTARAKTAGANCTNPPVLRVTDGSTGQDLPFPGTVDSGAFALKFGANADVQVKMQAAANCGTAPSDTNVLVEYKVTDATDVNTCAQAGQACNGICELTVTDPNNCGACANACSFANAASGGCVNSQCQQGACNTGFANCDNNSANGCGTNVTNDVNNCGACGNACPGGFNNAAHTDAAACTGGTCGLVCISGWADCDGQFNNGCETNIATDMNNCGACGSVCGNLGPGYTCTNGACLGASGAICDFGTDCQSGVCQDNCGGAPICFVAATCQ